MPPPPSTISGSRKRSRAALEPRAGGAHEERGARSARRSSSMAALLRKQCSTFSLVQRGPTCYMAATTLVIGRALLPHIEHAGLREFVLRSQGHADDEALPPEAAPACPRVPDAVGQFYFQYWHMWRAREVRNGVPVRHRDVFRRPMLRRSGEGGIACGFLSAMLWTAFRRGHLHVEVVATPRPRVGHRMVVAGNDGQPWFGSTGTVVDVDERKSTMRLRMERPGGATHVEVPFHAGRSAQTGMAYPFPEPASVARDAWTRTLLTTVYFSPEERLEYVALLHALPAVLAHARRARLRVLAMLVNVPDHVVAMFPCPTFPYGWMVCNTWPRMRNRCQTFPAFVRDMKRRGILDGGIRGASLLYAVRPP